MRLIERNPEERKTTFGELDTQNKEENPNCSQNREEECTRI
jgi:hypothetical protein